MVTSAAGEELQAATLPDTRDSGGPGSAREGLTGPSTRGVPLAAGGATARAAWPAQARGSPGCR